MILADRDILKLVDCDKPIISPFERKNLGPSSVDLRLADIILTYDCDIVDLAKNDNCTRELRIPSSGYIMQPKEFILGSTIEWVDIPASYQAWVETRGNIARAGIQVHNCDGHIDPGFSGRITLELVNNNTVPVKIYPNFEVCQIFIIKLSQESNQPYRGKYQLQTGPTRYEK